MRSKTDVTREIRKIVQDKIDAGVMFQVDWLTTEIISTKDQIEGDDADFYIACGVDFVKAAVKRVVGGYAPKPNTDQQLVMDGFDYLQKAYTVQRGGQTILVPVTMLSDAELKERALEYEAMSKGCMSHAKEIRAFIRDRTKEGAA